MARRRKTISNKHLDERASQYPSVRRMPSSFDDETLRAYAVDNVVPILHALNMLGLDTQVPAVYSYISTGPYASVHAGPYDIRFKHAANKNIAGMSQTTALVVQALKALGKDNVTDETIARLAARLDAHEKALLLEETERTTAWARQVARRIAKGGTR